jgi:hypothetical protein
MNSEQECYGKMFPSIVEVVHDKPVAGRVFGFEADYSGQVARKRDATVNRDAWRECLRCRDFDSCYRLSMGTILMELAVKSTPQALY